MIETAARRTSRVPVSFHGVQSRNVTLLLNSLNRSLGQDDAYPFALSPAALAFVAERSPRITHLVARFAAAAQAHHSSANASAEP